MPPIRYLHDYRVQRAKDILSSDYDSVTQVAESVGYNSVYHFSKMFRLYTGISPTEYAKASRR
jgi:AraC-like DNA-binding protein